MWFYLFGKNENYPDPGSEIMELARKGRNGAEVFLKLSPRDDAPLKNAKQGEVVYLCTREQGRWLVHGEATLFGDATRGATPDSMLPVYGGTGDRHWWRRLQQIRVYSHPRGELDLGLAHGTLPELGQAHVIHLPTPGNGADSGSAPDSAVDPLDTLSTAMDEAWESGRLSTEEIEAAIGRFRKAHPYGR